LLSAALASSEQKANEPESVALLSSLALRSDPIASTLFPFTLMWGGFSLRFAVQFRIVVSVVEPVTLPCTKASCFLWQLRCLPLAQSLNLFDC
jgi:hypothetical protein